MAAARAVPVGELVPFGTGSTPRTSSPHPSLAGQSHGDIRARVHPCPCQTPSEVWGHPAFALPHAETLRPSGCRAAMNLQLQQTDFQQGIGHWWYSCSLGQRQGRASQPAPHAGPGRLPSKLGSPKLWLCIQAVILPKPAARRCERRDPGHHLAGSPRKGSRGRPGFWITFAKDILAKQTCNDPNSLSSLGGQILHKYHPG